MSAPRRDVGQGDAGFVLALARRLRGLSTPTAVLGESARCLGLKLRASRVGFVECGAVGSDTRVSTPYVDADGPLAAAASLARLATALSSALSRGGTLRSADLRLDATVEAGALAALGTASLVAVPLTRDGRLGAVLFVDGPGPRTWTDAEVALVEEVAEWTFESYLRSGLEIELRRQVGTKTAERDRLWRLSADALAVADRRGVLTVVNPAFERLVEAGPGGAVGLRFQDVAGKLDDGGSADLDGDRWDGETTVEGATGAKRASWTAIVEDGEVHVSGRDVTARHESQREYEMARDTLAQAIKMDALGRMTGGIAHDFNNQLMVIVGALESIGRVLDDEHPRQRRACGNALSAADRAAKLTSRLLAFSRRQPLDPKPVDTAALVTGTVAVLTSALGEATTVRISVEDGTWPVDVDAGQFESALVNLAVNARDAMPDGGPLTIAAVNVAAGSPEAARNGLTAAVGHVRISVRDEGVGMDEATSAKAFDPFFTTKEVGKGTGLGLSQVYGFARQSRGAASIDSRPGGGTTVAILLPRSMNAPADPGAGAGRRTDPRPGGRIGGTIFVVEDDEDVRTQSVESLRDMGYTVVSASDGPTALAMMDGMEGEIDLLFSDVILPEGMTGDVLAERASASRPDMKILFTSGYARTSLVSDGRLKEGVNLLSKPYRRAELAEKIRSVLAG